MQFCRTVSNALEGDHDEAIRGSHEARLTQAPGSAAEPLLSQGSAASVVGRRGAEGGTMGGGTIGANRITLINDTRIKDRPLPLQLPLISGGGSGGGRFDGDLEGAARRDSARGLNSRGG